MMTIGQTTVAEVKRGPVTEVITMRYTGRDSIARAAEARLLVDGWRLKTTKNGPLAWERNGIGTG
jgi:hypothetical protein